LQGKVFFFFLLGFCFVSFDSEDTVDKICEQQFHHIDGNKVSGVVIHLHLRLLWLVSHSLECCDE